MLDHDFIIVHNCSVFSISLKHHYHLILISTVKNCQQKLPDNCQQVIVLNLPLLSVSPGHGKDFLSVNPGNAKDFFSFASSSTLHPCESVGRSLGLA